MPAKLLKGADVAKEIRAELKTEVEQLQAKHGVVPGLVTILVGENPASQSYVRAKQKTGHELGFFSIQDDQPADLEEGKLLGLIAAYNKDPKVHGILVQTAPFPNTSMKTGSSSPSIRLRTWTPSTPSTSGSS